MIARNSSWRDNRRHLLSMEMNRAWTARSAVPTAEHPGRSLKGAPKSIPSLKTSSPLRQEGHAALAAAPLRPTSLKALGPVEVCGQPARRASLRCHDRGSDRLPVLQILRRRPRSQIGRSAPRENCGSRRRNAKMVQKTLKGANKAACATVAERSAASDIHSLVIDLIAST